METIYFMFIIKKKRYLRFFFLSTTQCEVYKSIIMVLALDWMLKPLNIQIFFILF
jgi:hypothetical protein